MTDYQACAFANEINAHSPEKYQDKGRIKGEPDTVPKPRRPKEKARHGGDRIEPKITDEVPPAYASKVTQKAASGKVKGGLLA